MVCELYDSAGMILYELCWYFVNVFTKPQSDIHLQEVLREKATNTSDEWNKTKILLQNITEHGILQ